MRRAGTVAVMAVLFGSLMIVVAPTASACSLPPTPAEQEQLDHADLVFEGLAVSSQDPNAGNPVQSSGDPIAWTFAVDRTIKGTAGQPQVVHSARSGATCGIEFEIGTRYRVFAKAVDGTFWTGLGSGTRQAPAEQLTTTTTPTTAQPPTTVRPAQSRSARGRITLTG